MAHVYDHLSFNPSELDWWKTQGWSLIKVLQILTRPYQNRNGLTVSIGCGFIPLGPSRRR